jgi:hypothetical protein
VYVRGAGALGRPDPMYSSTRETAPEVKTVARICPAASTVLGVTEAESTPTGPPRRRGGGLDFARSVGVGDGRKVGVAPAVVVEIVVGAAVPRTEGVEVPTALGVDVALRVVAPALPLQPARPIRKTQVRPTTNR